MDKNNDTFNSFLSRTPSQKEVSLVIAQDESEQKALTAKLRELDFRNASSPLDLLEVLKTPSQVYVVLDGQWSKELYDVCVQYPTGTIELLDCEHMAPVVVTPQYESTALVYVITKDALIEIEKQGYQLRQATGLTFQT